MKNSIIKDRNSRKLLIIGANGFLGSNLLLSNNVNEISSKNFHFIGADIQNTNLPIQIPFYHIDLTKIKDMRKKIEKISPNIIILTAAITNVDDCERNKKLATKINFESIKEIVKSCKRIECKLLFMSTDFVFDGNKKNGNYIEKDIPNPLNHYGKTKYKAEQTIINSEIHYIICRTAVLYGWNPNKLNFITWILNNLEKSNKISILINQINSPTLVNNLAQILLKLIEKEAEGIFHTTGDDSLSRFEMALKCAEIFNYDEKLIIPIKELSQIAIRPKNAGLDISKIKNLIGKDLKVLNLEEGLKYMKNNRIR